MQIERLIFTQLPSVTIATNTFVNTPIILQYESEPLIELVKRVDASFEFQVPVFDADGTKLAVVKGTQIYPTPEGRKAGVEMIYPQGMTVCLLGKRPIFEMRRTAAAAVRATAELHTHDGSFVKVNDAGLTGHVLAQQGQLEIGKLTMSGCTVTGRIGILVRADGSVSIACA